MNQVNEPRLQLPVPMDQLIRSGHVSGKKVYGSQTVTDEFERKEKIDIIQWNKDDKLFIIAALSPAKVIDVEVDRENKRAKITVDEAQAPLAIGKGGVNVNLASRLTGYTLDIVQTKPASSEVKTAITEVKPQA